VAANNKSSGSKQTKSKSSSGSASKSRARASSSGANRSRRSGGSTAKRSTQSRSRSSQSRSPQSRSPQSQSSNGFVGTVIQAASKAKGPAVAVGATAAGVAGGLLIRSRTRQKKVLGVPVPRSFNKPDVDIKSMAKTVGKASRQLGQTTKTVSRDMERVGDQAERFGKMLD
jgi:hypothetical protein